MASVKEVYKKIYSVAPASTPDPYAPDDEYSPTKFVFLECGHSVMINKSVRELMGTESLLCPKCSESNEQS